jgi:hypothetical protein
MSEVVIKNMNKKYATAKRPGLSFEQMDALNTTYENEQFNVILDKGTLDALMPDNKQDTVERIEKLFKVRVNFGNYSEAMNIKKKAPFCV